MSGLRRLALRSGAVLTVREAAGMAIRLAGVLLVTRLIGPESFGLYAGAAAVVTVLAIAAQLGAELYLIRREDDPAPETYDHVFSVLVVSTLVTVAGALALSLAAEAIGVERRVLDPFRVLVLTIPVNVLWAPAQARLERAFRFGRMAVVEVGGDVVLYGTAVPLAFAGAGVWAPVAGYAAWQTWLLLSSCALARYRPRWRWSAPQARELVRYGLQYAPVPLLTRAELLVNPFVVGPLLGAASVGYVALVIRLVETLSFAVRATWRLAVVALARVQRDRARLARGLEESMLLQILGVAPILAAFALGAPWLVPWLFGDEWAPAVDLYPYFATAAVLLAITNAHYAVLYVLGRQVVLARISLLRLALLAAAAVALVPPFELTGYGLAALAPFATLALSDREVRRAAPFRYGLTAWWTAAFVPALFAPLLPPAVGAALLAAALAVGLTPAARTQLAGYVALARGARRPG